MNFFVLCLLVFYPLSLQAKCAPHDDVKIIHESKNVLEGEILSKNFKTTDLNSCGIGTKRLVYSVRVTNSLGKKLTLGEYKLSYEYHCIQKPSDIVFDVGKTYLLAIKNIENLNLELVGLTCGWWGWDISSKDSISIKVNEYCANKERDVDEFIEVRRACNQDSDCDYISHSTSYIQSNSCHRFVNKVKIPEIKAKIKAISSGVCLGPPPMLCKAPLKKLIKCKDKKCLFPH